MKIKFDPNQQFQIDAVNSIVDIFEGQPQNLGDFEISIQLMGVGLFTGVLQTQLGIGNNLLINETPMGQYNPDWAILKQDDKVLYLVRETKGTKNFETLRNSEADKIRCGRSHFKELNIDFAVAVKASEV